MWIMEIPRNIRQIGDIENSFQLYVEDYAATFIEKIKRRGGTAAGLLLGKKEKGDPAVMFIRGAVLFEQVEAEEGRTVIPASSWSRAYEEMGDYFKDVEVCGWFLCTGDESLTEPYSLQKTHGENFKDEDQILFLWDSAREDEAVYRFDAQGPRRLRGYYIYYERNDQMQEYMVSREPARKTEYALTPALRGTTDEAAKQFRAVMDEKKDKGKKSVSGVLRAVRAAALLCGIGFGLAAWYRYDRMQAVRDVIAVIAGGNEETAEDGAAEGEGGQAVIQEVPGELPSSSEAGEEAPEASSAGAESESAEASGKPEAETDSEPETEPEAETDSEPETEPETESEPETEPETDSETETEAQAEPSYREYRVRTGDTLSSICEELYGEHGSSLVREICRLNDMENADVIYEGQILLLPE